MADTHDAARLREALTIVLKEGAGLLPPPLEDAVLIARLRAACASFHDRPRLSPQELLSFAQGERFEPAFRNLLLETFSDKNTAFFRDKEMLAYIGDNLLKHNAKKTVTIWCAACSTGQEALSLVMTWYKQQQREHTLGEPALGEPALGEHRLGDTESRLVVYASDMSARVIETARTGRYNNFDVQHGLNVHDLLGFFDEQQGGGFWKAKDALLSHITFFQHNLLRTPPSFLPRRWDAILLPHTLQNFDAAIAERVLVRLVSLLAPEGWLVLAPQEAEKYGERFFSQPSGDVAARPSPPKGMLSRRAFAYPDRSDEGMALQNEQGKMQVSSSSSLSSRMQASRMP